MVTAKSLELCLPLRPALLVLLIAWAAPSGIAFAQPRRNAEGALERTERQPAARPEPIEIEPDEDPPAARPNHRQLDVDATLKSDSYKVDEILRTGRFASPQEESLFDEYYRNYFLARWTEVKNVTSLPAWRKEMRTSHLGKRSSDTQVHDHLGKLVLDFMKRLAAGPYHPAVQVNAMLMIGELNSVEQPPTPLPEALPVMVAAASNPKFADALRVAAMVGIQRQAEAKISDQEARRSVGNAMLKLAGEDLPQGSARDGREWLLAGAVETLGSLGSPGANGDVANAMVKVVSDPKLRFSTRCIAAQSLGRLNYSGAAGIDPAQAAAAVGRLAVDTCDEALKSIGSVDLATTRRRMKQGLSAALSALKGDRGADHKGIASLAQDAVQQARLADLQKKLDAFDDLLDDRNREDEDLEAPVDTLRGDLAAWLETK